MEDDKTIIYRSYDNLYDAIYARDFLRESGIESFVSDDSMYPMSPIVSEGSWGTKLHIFEKDKAKVDEILSNI